MSDYDHLRSIMDGLRESDDHIVVEEQNEDVHRGGHEQLTELQEDLQEQRLTEDSEVDREPAHLGRDV